MKFAERDEGNYRIYAGAFEAAGGGYHASVVIVRWRGVKNPPVEAYRGEMLDNARAFNRDDLALDHAMRHATQIIRVEPRMLAH
jgi:hypothetical protein